MKEIFVSLALMSLHMQSQQQGVHSRMHRCRYSEEQWLRTDNCLD
jgi:hypothetical protein